MLGVHRLGIVTPAAPELRAERHPEVRPAGHPEVLQRRDPDERSRDRRHVQRDIRPEALSHEHDARPPLRRDPLQALANALEDHLREHHAVVRLGHRERGRDEGVLGHDGRAVAPREVLQGLDDRVVDVAHARGARHADDGTLESAAGLEVAQTERRPLPQVRGTLIAGDDAHGIDRRLAHDRRDLLRGERHEHESAPLLADGVEGHVAAGPGGDEGIRGRLRVRRLHDVVLVLQSLGDRANGVGARGAHGTEDRPVRQERSQGARIPADDLAEERLEPVRGELLGDDEGAQPESGHRAHPGRRRQGLRVHSLDATALTFDGAVLVGPSDREVDVARRDRRSGGDVGQQGGVETGLEVQPPVEQLIPQRRRPAGDAGEGELTPGGVARGRDEVLLAGPCGRERGGVAAGDGARGHEHPGERARSASR